MRLFVAVLFPAEVRRALAQAGRKLCGQERSLRLIPEENLHLTLQFLGEIQPARLPALEAALADAAARTRPFSMEFSGSGVFPGPGHPRVVWIGLSAGAEQLKALASHVHAALTPLGLAPDKPFSPHITIARARDGAEPFQKSLPPGALASTEATAIDLMESQLSKGGARYRSLRKISFPPPLDKTTSPALHL